ncbi:MAG: pyrrolo-quinoline quinone, partial [Candidatus Rokuibacteriota bacterium]
MVTVPRLCFIVLTVFSFTLTPLPILAAEWRTVTDDRLLNADGDAANWLMYNRTYNGWRYSPLDQITTANIKKLVPKFIFSGGAIGEQQMTPIVNDGVM